MMESSIIQHGELLTRLLYAFVVLVLSHKHALTAQWLQKFKYHLMTSFAASCDAAVQEYIRCSPRRRRQRRRRGRFSASISRGTNPPTPSQHHQQKQTWDLHKINFTRSWEKKENEGELQSVPLYIAVRRVAAPGAYRGRKCKAHNALQNCCFKCEAYLNL